MEDVKHRAYEDAHKDKQVFWRTESSSSRWLKLVRNAARRLRSPALRAAKQRDD